MNQSDSNSSVMPSTPTRAKRTSGTSNNSPHKITTFSPPKKKNRTIATNTTDHYAPGPAPDFDIPAEVARLEPRNVEHALEENAFSPFKSEECRESFTDCDYDMLADLDLLSDMGVAVDDVDCTEEANLKVGDLGIEAAAAEFVPTKQSQLHDLLLASAQSIFIKSEHVVLPTQVGRAHASAAVIQHNQVQAKACSTQASNNTNVQTERVPVEEENHGESVPQPQLKIPAKLSTAFPTFEVMPKCCVFLPSVREMGSDNPQDFASEEDITVTGEGGLLMEHNTIWAKNGDGKKKSKTGKKKNNDYEYVTTYYCKAHNRKDKSCSCRFEMKIVGVKNGLMALQRCDIVDGVKVPIQHNTAAHHKFRNSGVYVTSDGTKKAGPLSLIQQEFLAKHYTGGDSDLLLKNVLEHPRVPCSNAQRAHTNEFKKSMFDFYLRNPQYCRGGTKKRAMTTELLLEILELLNTDPKLRDDNNALVGASGDDYYTISTWKKYMWKYIYVVSHDYDHNAGKFTKVLFTVTDIAQRCAAAASTFPNGKVQLETDYFTVVGVPWQVGHIGVSDYNHKYWGLAFQISDSENKQAVWELLQFALYCVENVHELETNDIVSQAQVTHVLADGGEAIRSAIEQQSNERYDAGGQRLALRRCFAHVIRMGMTRGGGIRGGKGSLPRYLLDQGVPPKVMAKMMSIIIMFNYIPDDEVFEEAMKLFHEKYKDHINEHVMSFYLDPTNSMKLGGRACGEQGMVGSNNGGEIKGGGWKTKFREIVRDHAPDDRQNFLYMMEAIAFEVWGTSNKFGHVDKAFATAPNLTKQDHNMV